MSTSCRTTRLQDSGISLGRYNNPHIPRQPIYLDNLDRLVQQRHNGYLHTLDRTCNGFVTVVQRNRSAWLKTEFGLLTLLWRLESPDGPIWVAKRIKGMAVSDLKPPKRIPAKQAQFRGAGGWLGLGARSLENGCL